MTGDHLLVLARAYCAETGISLRQLGRLALAGNHKFFARLEAGNGVNTKSIERAEDWLSENWPPEVPWPSDVPRPRRRRCAAGLACVPGLKPGRHPSGAA